MFANPLKKEKKLRRKDHVLRVPVFPNEKQMIEENAKTAGLSVAEYLRRTGMGYPIVMPVDRKELAKLDKANADLGRLGGLLKLWLTDDVKKHGLIPNIRSLLQKIEESQKNLNGILKKI